MSKSKISHLPYTNDFLSYYRKLSSLPGFVLLQSSDKNLGRYDIVTAFPYKNIELNQANLSKKSVFKELDRALTLEKSNSELPFQGGAIGFFSYDLATYLAGLSYKPLQDLQDLPLVYLNFYDWALIVDHKLKNITVFSGETESDTKHIVEEVINIWQSNACLIPKTFKFSNLNSLTTKETYEEAFHKIKADIQRGRCYQVNLTQIFELEYRAETWDIYENIIKVNPVPFSAYMSLNDKNLLSFSPERFLLKNEQTLLASPIKGTIHRGQSFAEDQILYRKLLDCPKNRAENVMIVDLLRNDFGKISEPGTISVPRLCKIESFSGVHHLVSTISGVCRKDISSFEAFAACFPSGSITGAPKLEAMKVIAELEPFNRGAYCGSLGYFSRHGRFDTNIAIRTLTATKDKIFLSAGGGIVMDSNCKDEYQECFTKISSIMRVLSLM